MRLPRTRIIGRVSLIGVVSLALGVRWREDRYSCHLCRALKEEQSTSWVGWPVRWRESVAESGDAVVHHRHDWWRYSYAYRNGLGGCLGAGVACHTDGRYKDQRREAGIRAGLPESK
jgi:hypothetical protein